MWGVCQSSDAPRATDAERANFGGDLALRIDIRLRIATPGVRRGRSVRECSSDLPSCVGNLRTEAVTRCASDSLNRAADADRGDQLPSTAAYRSADRRNAWLAFFDTLVDIDIAIDIHSATIAISRLRAAENLSCRSDTHRQ
jgi:hypothetical protein